MMEEKIQKWSAAELKDGTVLFDIAQGSETHHRQILKRIVPESAEVIRKGGGYYTIVEENLATQDVFDVIKSCYFLSDEATGGLNRVAVRLKDGHEVSSTLREERRNFFPRDLYWMMAGKMTVNPRKVMCLHHSSQEFGWGPSRDKVAAVAEEIMDMDIVYWVN